MLRWLIAHLEDFGGDTADDGVGEDVTDDDGVGSDDGVVAYGDGPEDGDATADFDAFADDGVLADAGVIDGAEGGVLSDDGVVAYGFSDEDESAEVFDTDSATELGVVGQVDGEDPLAEDKEQSVDEGEDGAEGFEADGHAPVAEAVDECGPESLAGEGAVIGSVVFGDE